MKQVEFEFRTKDGIKLFAREWCTDKEPQGVVCLIHGLGEHCGRYNHLAEALTKEGFCMLAFDQRGHGRTGGRRGHISSYEAVMEDISILVEEAERRFPSSPCFLYGHSLGGNFVLNFALRRRSNLRGVIATSPWLRLINKPSRVLVGILKVINVLCPSYTQSNRLDSKMLSHNAGISESYINDSLVHDKISARLITTALEAAQWALEHAGEFPVPLLLMHGTGDGITSCEGSKEFAGKVKGECCLRFWDGLYHELHNEPQQDEVFSFVLQWLKAHVAGKSCV